jgi:hypothetical protein
MDEETARQLVERAVEQVGGGRMVVGSPRHPYTLNPTREESVEGHVVTIRYGEISSPAIAEIEGWVFEVLEDGLELLDRPRPRQRR